MRQGRFLTSVLTALVMSAAFASTARGEVLLQEGFEGVTPPALPAGWSNSYPFANLGNGTAWFTTNVFAVSGSNSAFVPDADSAGLHGLSSPPIKVPERPTFLSFTAFFSLESRPGGDAACDTASLWIQIDSGPIIPILDSGAKFNAGPYNSTALCSNPGASYATVPAWSGVRILGSALELPQATLGHTVTLFFLVGTDSSPLMHGFFPGWRIDDVLLNSPGFSKPKKKCKKRKKKRAGGSAEVARKKCKKRKKRK